MIVGDWSAVVHTLVVGPIAYVTVVAFLRVSGKRTLAKMNAFDLVVTVALGSTLATIFLSTDVSALRGAVALALLVVLQFLVAGLASRSNRFQDLVKSTPRLILAHGRIDEEAIAAERVAREEVLAAVRASGHARLEDVAFVVLETDGTFSVIAGSGGRPTALANVRGAGAPPHGRATAAEARS